ncbi:MAG TPA: efflux RND transporter periplasmic adaptor subunit [Nitrospirae bacterium]|nr:multidrug resistance protein MdtA precursor [bacterium BMS3Abin06]HDH11071.1 efflux RND transporter periplasmic adaptor subunit [Nitrospirota bacterium]HDZ01700.1 efflux RND transporter periplasmic adaptor subunit [Nitrospirota bacterium]
MRKLIFIITFISGLSVLFGCGDKIKPGEHEVERPLVEGVGIEEVMPVEITGYYETSGTVRAKNTSLVSAKVMGVVEDVKVKVSDPVRKGDLLLVINSPDIEAGVHAAEEALGEANKGLAMAEENKKLAEKTFERFKKLYEEKAVSEQEFDEIKTKRDVAILEYELSQKSLRRAGAALSGAEAFRDYTIIRSPVNGIVAEKKIDIGSMTAPGIPLFIIEEPPYRVEVAVDEGMISSVNTGMPVAILIDALNIKTTGRIGEIVRLIDPLTRTFTVKIDMEESIKPLRGGFYAAARFPVGKRSEIFVDENAVVTRGELRGVYAVNEEGVITLRLVKTGKKNNGMIEILSGLNKGDRIIVKGVDKALDGGRVG